MDFTLTSPAFNNGAVIPLLYTCSGEDVSPALEWQDAPSGTKSFALTCSDPDAPGGTFYHWAVFDIPGDWRRMAQAIPRQASLPGGLRQAVNDFGRIGYAGPCPPVGHGPHHYYFRLLALDVEHLELGDDPRCREVEPMTRPHCLAVTEIVGLFER
ncbi:MAG: YbhB/YbcL family Raf kinase inhibitor-like protein [Allorhizobium sp.]